MPTHFTDVDHANFRREAGFGNNVISTNDLGTAVDVTGAQVGDRWMPATVDGANGFISKNVIRPAESEAKERLARICIAEWLRFERGTGKEYQDPFVDRVGDYWASIGMDHLDGLDRGQPWSAAFISWCVRQAGGYDGFVYAAAHARYIHASIAARSGNKPSPFWGFRLNEHRPGIGDMVCRWRQNRIDYDYAAETRWFKSHCDIVVAVEDGRVLTIGGNVRHSVRHTRYDIDANGHLTGDGNVFAVLRNNL
ncbi:DUF2272 domain-containing protein [Pseudaestuariivita atlantica]|uniref:DUF2272 domain-containing protein n=1 Tax=Pseudaestuariivita atlantica TaxID=1317121 RepID=UPI00067BD79E|nr:DUF2272 domain-containing protein [Pseudaestuariivita atlantica]